MRKSLPYVYISLFVFLILVACKKEQDAKYFPGDITGDWYNESDAANIFSFRTTDPPSRAPLTYTFVGTERSSSSPIIKQFNGHYNEKGIFWEYYVNGIPSGKTYSGTLNATATLITPNYTTTITLVKK